MNLLSHTGRDPVVSEEWDRAIREKTAMRRYTYSVYCLCEDLHMSLNGAGDPMQPEEEEMVVRTLQARLTDWHPTACKAWERYDEAMRSLIEAVLSERIAKRLERALT